MTNETTQLRYLQNGANFPDLLILDDAMLKAGLSGVTASGWFGNDWSIASGEFVWKPE